MKLTKYNHSCFVLEKDSQALVVDPGVWANDFRVPENVVAIVVTHEHFDHFDPERLQTIIASNPEAVIYTPQAVAGQAKNLPIQVVKPGEQVEIGNFTLKFIGGKHATIHEELHSPFENIGVIVDDSIYHPGDSLHLPDIPIKVLSLPIVAPWEKASESVDFLTTIKPEIAFPSHDGFLNENGIQLYDRWHGMAAEKFGITYQRIQGSIEI